jgi:hypothetical protein
LIIQVPRGGAVHRHLSDRPPAGSDRDEVVVEAGDIDAKGNLEPPAAGEVVISVPSPESLTREADEVRRVVAEAHTGSEPPVVLVEAAEELTDAEVGVLLDASRHAPQPVILRVIRNA